MDFCQAITVFRIITIDKTVSSSSRMMKCGKTGRKCTNLHMLYHMINSLW